MQRYKRFTLLKAYLVILSFLTINAYAQISETDINSRLSGNAPTLRFENLGLEEGLQQSSGNTIMQDSRGYIWISTQDGLHGYDGYEFKVYTNVPLILLRYQKVGCGRLQKAAMEISGWLQLW